MMLRSVPVVVHGDKIFRYTGDSVTVYDMQGKVDAVVDTGIIYMLYPIVGGVLYLVHEESKYR